MEEARRARTARAANAAIDALEKFGEGAVYAISEVVDNTKFEEVRLHGLEVIKQIKRDDTEF